MSMKRHIVIEVSSPLKFRTRRGTLRVDPGKLQGVMSIGHFTRAGYDDAAGLFIVGLQWNTPNGNGADYTSILNAVSLLPTQCESTLSTWPATRPWDFVPAMSLDHRSEYQFEIKGQEPLRGRWKYTTISPYMYFRESTVLIKLALNTDDSRADRGIIVLEYTLPLDVLLWRKAPRLLPDEVFTEEEPWVDVQELSAPVPDLPTSPVWIEA